MMQLPPQNLRQERHVIVDPDFQAHTPLTPGMRVSLAHTDTVLEVGNGFYTLTHYYVVTK